MESLLAAGRYTWDKYLMIYHLGYTNRYKLFYGTLLHGIIVEGKLRHEGLDKDCKEYSLRMVFLGFVLSFSILLYKSMVH